MRVAIIMAGLLALAAPGVASARDLPVPIGKGWQHADSGVVLTASIAGLPRTTLIDGGTDERDIVAEFTSPDHGTIATVYIFHPALMSVPIWFDRSQTAIELRDLYGGAIPVAPLPTPVAQPGGTVTAGLRQVYVPGHGKYKSTALAMIPTGAWLVTIRLSSTTLDPAGADTKLSALIAAIRWPVATGDAVVATPVAACAESLKFHKALLIKPDLIQALLGASMVATAMKDRSKNEKRAEWCRDPVPPTVDYGVYQQTGAGDGYTLAIADSGRIASVYKGLLLQGGATSEDYAVSYTDLDGSVATFPSFDVRPQPAQVLALVLGGKAPIARTDSAGGKTNITLGVSLK